jgi:hypothetical protein
MTKFTMQNDYLIVQYFDVLECSIEDELPQSWPSIQKRAKLLRSSGLWDQILLLQRVEWVTIREHELLSPTKRLIAHDEIHEGSMICAYHFNDLMSAKEYASETKEWFDECKKKILTEKQWGDDEYRIKPVRIYEQDKYAPRLNG